MYSNFLDYAIDMLRKLVRERKAHGEPVEYSCVEEDLREYLRRTDPENADEIADMAEAFNEISNKLDEL